MNYAVCYFFDFFEFDREFGQGRFDGLVVVFDSVCVDFKCLLEVFVKKCKAQ